MTSWRRVDQLATDARASGGRRGEAAYLCREAADALREALGGRRGPVQDRAWSGRVLDGVQHDVRSSLRHMRDRPLATAGVVGALALAVGSVATTYAVATAVLWRPLPFPDPDGLVFVWEAAGDDDGAFRVTSGRFADWSRTNRAFSQMALFSAASFSLDGPDGGRPFRGVRVGATYFDTLGLRPMLGRGFTADDETPGRDHVIVLSHAAWRQRLGARLDVVGTELRLSGEPFTVVGVMPDVVTPTWPANPARVGVDARQREFWVPMAQTPQRLANTTSHVYGVVARLAPGVTAERAGAETARRRLTPRPPTHTPAWSPHSASSSCATRGHRFSRCSPHRWPSCSWPVPTSPPCTWRSSRAAGPRWPCARPLAPAGAGSRASCSSTPPCWRSSAVPLARRWRRSRPRGCPGPCRPRSHSSPHRASTCRWPGSPPP